MTKSTLLRKLGTAATLAPREWIVFVEAWLTILSVQFELLFVHKRVVRSSLSETVKTSTNREITRRSLELFVMARNSAPFATCLPRSIALQRFLRRRGIHADLRIGGRRRENAVEAHAWVEIDGVPIAERSDIRDLFTPFESGSNAVKECFGSRTKHRDSEIA